MDRQFLEGLMVIVSKSDVSELEYSEGDTRIRIVRRAGVLTAGGAADLVDAASAPDRIDGPQAAAAKGTTHAIKSGVAGVFYRAPSPGAAPFVALGDSVREGQVLGLLEAMKMLTPIEADRSGKIVAIEVEDGATVPAGARLFILEPAD